MEKYSGIERDKLSAEGEDIQGTIGTFMSSQIHKSYTVAGDILFGAGLMSEAERIGFSSAITDALTAFKEKLKQEYPEASSRKIPVGLSVKLLDILSGK